MSTAIADVGYPTAPVAVPGAATVAFVPPHSHSWHSLQPAHHSHSWHSWQPAHSPHSSNSPHSPSSSHSLQPLGFHAGRRSHSVHPPAQPFRHNPAQSAACICTGGPRCPPVPISAQLNAHVLAPHEICMQPFPSPCSDDVASQFAVLGATGPVLNSFTL